MAETCSYCRQDSWRFCNPVKLTIYTSVNSPLRQTASSRTLQHLQLSPELTIINQYFWVDEWKILNWEYTRNWRTYSPPNNCIPRRAKIKMNKKSKNNKEMMERILLSSEMTRLRNDDQYLSTFNIKHCQSYNFNWRTYCGHFDKLFFLPKCFIAS